MPASLPVVFVAVVPPRVASTHAAPGVTARAAPATPQRIKRPWSPWPLLAFIAALLPLAVGCMSTGGSNSADANVLHGDAAGDAPDSSPDDVVDPDATPFEPASHDPLPQVNSRGGPVLAHPGVVLITYPNTPVADQAEQFIRWYLASDALHEAGADYGVDRGTLVTRVQMTTPLPSYVASTTIIQPIHAMIADGRIPSSPDPSQPYLYLMLLPPTTTRVDAPWGLIHFCADEAGFHSQFGTTFEPLAMVSTACIPADRGLATDLEVVSEIASHEIFEAATNPFVGTRPAYVLGESNVWSFYGSELADLCSWSYERTADGHVVARSWSNSAAAAGRNPCVPYSAQSPYRGVAIAPSARLTAHAGETLQLTLRGWSMVRTPPWRIRTFASGDSALQLSLDHDTIGNGDEAALTVMVPDDAQPGDVLRAFVYTRWDPLEIEYTPFMVVVQ